MIDSGHCRLCKKKNPQFLHDHSGSSSTRDMTDSGYHRAQNKVVHRNQRHLIILATAPFLSFIEKNYRIAAYNSVVHINEEIQMDDLSAVEFCQSQLSPQARNR